MEPSYSVVADWLSKFHTWPAFIQALWLLVVPATVLGSVWLVMRGLRDIAAAARRPDRETWDSLVYEIVQDGQGRLHVIRHGSEPQPLDGRDLPRELPAPVRRPG